MHYRSTKRKTFLNSVATSQKALETKFLAVPALLVFDGAAIGFAFLTAFYLRANLLNTLLPSLFPEKLLATTSENIWWFPLVMLFCLAYENLYTKRLPYWKEVEHILKAITLALIFTIVLLYMTKTTLQVSRSLVAMIGLMLIIFLPLMRYLGKNMLVRAGIWVKPVLIVGAGKTACLLCSALERENTMGYQVIGILNDRGKKAETPGSASACTIPILGDVSEAEKVITATGVQDIIIAMPALPASETVTLANRLQPLVNNLILIPDLFGLSLSGIEAQHFFEEQVLMLNIKNRLKSITNRFIKRSFDLFIGSIMLLLCTPLLFALALAIKFDSRGPVFYNGRRIGQHGKIFSCHKFRTMHTNSAEILQKHLNENQEARLEWDQFRKLKSDDPRLTGVGRWLRRFSLDELPQLFNVVNGEMSLVGPRPYLPSEKALMGVWFADIVITKPGITGLWQVSGRNLINFEGRLKLGAWYVKNWSLWLDLIIILKTTRVVIRGEGAY